MPEITDRDRDFANIVFGPCDYSRVDLRRIASFREETERLVYQSRNEAAVTDSARMDQLSRDLAACRAELTAFRAHVLDLLNMISAATANMVNRANGK